MTAQREPLLRAACRFCRWWKGLQNATGLGAPTPPHDCEPLRPLASHDSAEEARSMDLIRVYVCPEHGHPTRGPSTDHNEQIPRCPQVGCRRTLELREAILQPKADDAGF